MAVQIQGVQVTDWRDIISKVSDTFKAAEAEMQEKLFLVEVEHQRLFWKKDERRNVWRIFFEDTVIHETKAVVRVEQIGKLPGLIKAAEEAMEKQFGFLKGTAV